MHFTNAAIATLLLAVSQAVALPEPAPVPVPESVGGTFVTSAFSGHSCNGDRTSGPHYVHPGTRLCLGLAGADSLSLQSQDLGGCLKAGLNYFDEEGCPNGEAKKIETVDVGQSGTKCYTVPKNSYRSVYVSCQKG